MAQQTINIGSSSNDGTGDPLRTAFNKINDNFTELYGSSPFGTQITLAGNTISANSSNADLVLSGSGTGGVIASGLRFGGTSISADDSSTVNINEGLNVDGNITAEGDITATGNIFANGNINLGNAASDQTKVVGVFEADNIQIDGTTITTNTTNGSLQIIGNGTGAVEVETLQIQNSAITPITTNGDLTLSGNGTGSVIAGSIKINGTSLSSDDSTIININEGLIVSGTGNFSGTLTTAAINTTGTHTVTGQLNADNLRMDGNVISSTDANGNITLTPNGTGSVVASGIKIQGTSISSDDSTQINLNENLNINGATVMTGTLTTTDVNTVGTHTVTGQSDIDFVRIKDHSITTNDSNANLNLSANGTGVVQMDSNLTTGNITTTGNVVIDGQFDCDNISISGNGIIATNSGGGININPNATGQVTLGGTTVQVTNILTANAMHSQTGITFGTGAKLVPLATNDDLVLEANGTGSVVLEEVSITANKITTHVSNADLELDTDGTGTIELQTDTNVTGSLTATGAATFNSTFTATDITANSLTTTVITSNGSNAELSLQPSGTGDVLISALRVNGTTLDSSDSTKITIAEAVDVTGVLTASTSIETPTITRTGDFEIDASGSILLDADSGTIFFQDGAAGTFGQVIRNNVNDLTIASGSTQAIIFTGADAAFQGDLSVAGSSTLDGVTITDNTIKTNASNSDLQIGTTGTGVIDILTATQTTVGSAGGADALPGQPTGYIKIKIGGTLRVIPFYDQA